MLKMNATCFLFKCGYKKITAMYTSPIILLLVSVRWALRPEAASTLRPSPAVSSTLPAHTGPLLGRL